MSKDNTTSDVRLLTRVFWDSSETQRDDVSGVGGLVVFAVIQQDGGLPAVGCVRHLRKMNAGQHTH